LASDKRVLMMVGTSPTETDLDWQLDLLDQAASRGVLLMQDGVLFALAENVDRLRREGLRLFALGPSLETRGVRDRVAPGVEVVDFHRAVDRMMDEFDMVV
jgi:sulfur relay protein TusB/DsrH